MLSNETTPRFRNLSLNGTARFFTSSSFGSRDHEDQYNPEKGCFMCRQANVYITPIGMQQERRIEQCHPRPLTRAKIEELSQKKRLTKREARKLLQCYFPEIKHVKYFQLHKYHSCCYDPKHLNLCKNHITALQNQHNDCPRHKTTKDENSFQTYEKDATNQNRVSFVRIKIEPTRGIPTRFLGPAALPESLADMLIQQVNRLENKKKPPEFGTVSESAPPMYNIRRIQQPYGHNTSSLSEQIANLHSDDDDDDDDDDNYSSDDEDDKERRDATSSIRGYNGKVMDRSRLKYERKLQSQQEKEKSKTPTTITNGDLVVEDLDEVNHLFVNDQDPSASTHKSFKTLKKRKRRGHTRKRKYGHEKPKLNHWEELALEQSKQEVCGCRHHVRRLEADQIVYDWCRCKDHKHKHLKEKHKSTPPAPIEQPPPPPPPPSPPEKKPKKKIRRPKPPVVEKRTVSVDATEPTTTELAVAYDPEAVDYDVIQETLYYRTSSGRMVKPQIGSAFTYDDPSSSMNSGRHKSLPKKEVIYTTLKDHFQSFEMGGKHARKNRFSMTGSPTLSHTESVSKDQGLMDAETVSTYKPPNSMTKTTYDNGNESPHDDNDEDATDSGQFIPPKYLPEGTMPSPVESPTVPISMQKSSKPTYTNHKPTPNFERETSTIASRRWFDQPLGDQNLLEVQNGRYGLIAGTSTEQYQIDTQLPDNDYIEQNTRRNRSNCTIS